MTEDWYVASIDRVEAAATDLHEALDATLASLRKARVERLAGVDLVDIVKGLVLRGGREIRLAPSVAFTEFERAVTSYRAAAVRALVDEEHMSFSDVARLTDVSRQMIARLYRRGQGSDAATKGVSSP
jgi:hypothetical protein